MWKLTSGAFQEGLFHSDWSRNLGDITFWSCPMCTATFPVCTCCTCCPITLKRLLHMAWNVMHVKADILVFPTRPISGNLTHKARRYSCLKLAHVHWKIADSTFQFLFPCLLVPHAYARVCTCCFPPSQLIRGFSTIKGRPWAAKKNTQEIHSALFYEHSVWRLIAFSLQILLAYP